MVFGGEGRPGMGIVLGGTLLVNSEKILSGYCIRGQGTKVTSFDVFLDAGSESPHVM